MVGRSALLIALAVLTIAPASARTEVKTEKGIASIYSTKLIGRSTASGELLSGQAMTAAHPKLPFGTRLLVTNRRNGRKVIVTVNDRGPHYKGRVIDLSPAAARELHMTHTGLAPVEFHIAERR